MRPLFAFAALAVLCLSGCYVSDWTDSCVGYSGSYDQCIGNIRCRWEPKEATCQPSAMSRSYGTDCVAACRVQGDQCVFPAPGNACAAVYPDDGRTVHDNSDIIGCRSSIDDRDRCALEIREGGAKVCVYQPKGDPCEGCQRPNTGRCYEPHRDPCIGKLCLRLPSFG